MDVSQIGNINFAPYTEQTRTIGETGKNSFRDFFDAAMNVINETNELQIESEQLQLDFVTGKSDNMVAVMLAQDKAYSSLNFTVQVTNKIIEAYREIMRMQV